MRTTGILAEILQGMRSGTLSDAAWHALQGRVLGNWTDAEGRPRHLPDGTADPRLREPPFSTHAVHYVLHRHQLRACLAFRSAAATCAAAMQPLYVSVACDELVEGPGRLTEEVRTLLLTTNNLGFVHNLPHTLAMYRGMRVLLCSEMCVRLRLVNGCVCVLEDIVFAVSYTHLRAHET